MAGGEAEPLTELPVAVRDFRWFPDGRRIAFAASTFPGLDDDPFRIMTGKRSINCYLNFGAITAAY